MEAHRFYPINLEVISWLGVWYVKSELYEKAIEFFDAATEIQPDEVRMLYIVKSIGASCLGYLKRFPFPAEQEFCLPRIQRAHLHELPKETLHFREYLPT